MKDIVATLGTLRGKAREYEKSALQIRNFAQLNPTEQLNPFELATKLGMKVVRAQDVPGITEITLKTLLVDKADEWSGASSGEQPDGTVFIVLNSTQSAKRRISTLMEEICHVLLGHQRNRLSTVLLGARDYHKKIESEAYGVGAAALVPFAGLKLLISKGYSVSAIARHYGVSESLVEYRIKVVQGSSD